LCMKLNFSPLPGKNKVFENNFKWILVSIMYVANSY